MGLTPVVPRSAARPRNQRPPLFPGDCSPLGGARSHPSPDEPRTCLPPPNTATHKHSRLPVNAGPGRPRGTALRWVTRPADGQPDCARPAGHRPRGRRVSPSHGFCTAPLSKIPPDPQPCDLPYLKRCPIFPSLPRAIYSGTLIERIQGTACSVAAARVCALIRTHGHSQVRREGAGGHERQRRGFISGCLPPAPSPTSICRPHPAALPSRAGLQTQPLLWAMQGPACAPTRRKMLAPLRVLSALQVPTATAAASLSPKELEAPQRYLQRPHCSRPPRTYRPSSSARHPRRREHNKRPCPATPRRTLGPPSAPSSHND